MTAVQIFRLLIQCEGCGVLFGKPLGFISSEDARAAAAEAGWTFPPKFNKRTQKPTGRNSDVCPDCSPDWTPRSAPSKARYISQSEQREWS